jgi:hypothetical protein
MDFAAQATILKQDLYPVLLEGKQMKPSWAAAMMTVPGYGEVTIRDDPHYSVRVVFTDHDRRLINDYYAPRYKKSPPGLAKQDKLTPGHACRARVNQPIHDDARWRYLPYELDQRLTRLPPEYVRVVIGTDVAIMNVRTRVVAVVLEDITD